MSDAQLVAIGVRLGADITLLVLLDLHVLRLAGFRVRGLPGQRSSQSRVGGGIILAGGREAVSFLEIGDGHLRAIAIFPVCAIGTAIEAKRDQALLELLHIVAFGVVVEHPVAQLNNGVFRSSIIHAIDGGIVHRAVAVDIG